MKRSDGRTAEQLRPMTAKVGIIPNANGSAMFTFGKTVAIAAVYGPRHLHPQHMQNPETAILRVNYDLLSFSVDDRKKPGPSRRSFNKDCRNKRCLNGISSRRNTYERLSLFSSCRKE